MTRIADWGRPALARALAAVVAAVALAAVAGCTAPTDPAMLQRAPATTSVTVDAGDGTVATVVARPYEGGTTLLVGDSVLVGASDDLDQMLPGTVWIDAIVCRRLALTVHGPCGFVEPGAPIPSGLEALGTAAASFGVDRPVPDAAVLVLANNGAIDASTVDQAMAVLADVPVVWWVTARSASRWEAINNHVIAELAGRDPRARVIDWFTLSAGQPWLSDAVHPNADGQVALARAIADALRTTTSP